MIKRGYVPNNLGLFLLCVIELMFCLPWIYYQEILDGTTYKFPYVCVATHFLYLGAAYLDGNTSSRIRIQIDWDDSDDLNDTDTDENE